MQGRLDKRVKTSKPQDIMIERSEKKLTIWLSEKSGGPKVGVPNCSSHHNST